jgi:RND family efflux transporter MFP subunit
MIPSSPLTAVARLLTVAPLALWAGCSSPETEAPAPKPPEVVIAQPIVREDAQALQFTGRTDAVNRVDIKARVSGYLEQVAFSDGAIVKTGDVLFQIDPRPYRATLAQAEAAVAQAKTALAKAEADLARAKPLLPSGAITEQEFDLRVAIRDSAASELEAANAKVEAAKLDLEFTTITAPIDGRISKSNVDKGNLVSANEGTVLTTIVQPDPVYVYFDVDERALLTVKAARVAEGKTLGTGDVSSENIPIEVGLVTEQGYPHKGTLDFVDNRLDPATATMKVRGKLSNPEDPLIPGLFVRVRVTVGAPRPVTFVAERALGIDQGQRFVYVVDKDNKVQYKAVTAGAGEGGLRPIQSDLPADAWLVVNGVQRVRPGIEVSPQRAKMMDFAAGASTAAPPVSAAVTEVSTTTPVSAAPSGSSGN